MEEITKEGLIEEFLSGPLRPGDYVSFQGAGNGSQNPLAWGYSKVKSVDYDTSTVQIDVGRSGTQQRKISEIRRCTAHIGKNPFIDPIRNTSYQFDIGQLFHRCGIEYGKTNFKKSDWGGAEIDVCCFNPIIESDDGDIEFQRGLVWTLDQKQSLVDSIYNRVDIGKFVFRVRDYDWITDRIERGKIKGTGQRDIVDGKQRASTLIEFIQDSFQDSYGNYFSDLSKRAQRQFRSYRNMTYVELPETTTDEEVLKTFLAINHTGKPMSKEHIEFVKEINKSL